jgi:hypothetical protein
VWKGVGVAGERVVSCNGVIKRERRRHTERVRLSGVERQRLSVEYAALGRMRRQRRTTRRRDGMLVSPKPHTHTQSSVCEF